MRVGALYIRREIFFDGIAHHVAAMAVEFAVVLYVAFEVIVLHVYSHFTLGDGRGSQVCRAFDQIHLRQDFVVADHPCQTHAGS